MNAVCKTLQGSVYGLLLALLWGCSTPLQNSVAPNTADVWVGSNQGTGRWSMKPGDSDIGITGLDSMKGDFPPLGYLDTAVDLSAPLHLAPGRHSIKLLLGAVFPVQPRLNAVYETVQTIGSGTIDGLFLANHAYRITALWINGSAHGSGTFDVTLWDVTQSDDSPARVQSWIFRGGQVQGPTHYVSP